MRFCFFRWSAIAARLPGRTDNEIKNVWHTHLKKRLKQNQANPETKRSSNNNISKCYHDALHELELEPVNFSSHAKSESLEYRAVSPQECSSDMSTVTMSDNNNENKECLKVESPRNFPEMDENFWSELSTENSEVVMSEFSAVDGDAQLQFQFSPLMTMESIDGYGSNMHDSMDYFWFNLFNRAGELPELLDV